MRVGLSSRAADYCVLRGNTFGFHNKYSNVELTEWALVSVQLIHTASRSIPRDNSFYYHSAHHLHKTRCQFFPCDHHQLTILNLANRPNSRSSSQLQAHSAQSILYNFLNLKHPADYCPLRCRIIFPQKYHDTRVFV